MAKTTNIINTRRFIVKGQLECIFTPNITDFVEEISNLEIELWQKSPLNIYLLGKGSTDLDGNFVIEFEVNDETAYLKEGKIDDVFAKVYYKQGIISGENPYTDTESSSNRPIKNITLQEGLTDIGSKQIEITRFEYPTGTTVVKILEKPEDSRASILFDIREASSGRPLPVGTSCSFRAFLEIDSNELDIFDTSFITTKEGYAELSTAPFPLALKKDEQDLVVNMQLNGIPSSASDQCYLRVDDGMLGYYYTPVTNLVIYEGVFSVYSKGNYYSITDLPDGLGGFTLVSITDTGIIGMYDPGTGIWSMSSQLTFYKFQFPEYLEEISAGLYAPSGSVGTIYSGHLGDDRFSQFSLTMESKGFFPINVELTIELDEVPLFDEKLYNLLPGDTNLVIVQTTDLPLPVDDSPDLSEIETVSDTVFTTTLVDFLTLKDLTTINKLKQAGPLRYISDFPATGTTPQEIDLLQSHIDLFSINENISQNQHLIDEGYGNLYKIAQTPKDVFINDVQDNPELPLYRAASLHNTVLQNQKLLTNMLSGKMKDCELEHPFIPDIAGSTFADTAFSKFVNRCECEDCTSAVSPFSYLVDLIKYGAKHIKKTGTPSYSPVNYNAFMTLLENYFFQPFGSFNVDCDTLHREYCRLRLVTEILEQYVATKTLPAGVALRLENDRKNFILLTYKTLLTQAGTSYEELRSIIAIQDSEQKIAAAQSLSDKLGVPLYDPTTSTLVAEVMWLTVGAGFNNELNAENLELIFGFRNTQRDVLTNPAPSQMADWKQAHLFDLWKSTDFLFSPYSREDVNPSDDNTFKADWKPIIDPDSFGRGDMTYMSSDFALALWRHRKADTDYHLNLFVSDPGILSRTSADIAGRKLRVPGIDVSGVDFQNNNIYIQNPTNNAFEPFEVLIKEADGAVTDITLRDSTINPLYIAPAMFQPEGSEPVMRYDSVLEAVNPTISTTSTEVIITWEQAQVFNYMDISSDGFVQLISSGAPLEIFTSDAGISNVVVSTDLKEVVLTLDTAPTAEFVEGTISFVYRAEVPLATTTVPDPKQVCDELFETEYEYEFLAPAPSGMDDPFTYLIWDDPVTWPAPIDSAQTNYEKLKTLYEIISSGTTTEAYFDIVTNNLHTDMYGFNLLMETLISYEQFLGSMYSHDEPDVQKRYQLASILRNSARQKLNEYWVQEEIKHIPLGGTDPEKLMLQSRFFWKPISEPQSGAWDSSLQTIPALSTQITASDVPIIDPELVGRQQLLISPDAKPYIERYDFRQEELDTQRDIYFEWLVPYQVEGFNHVLNHINTGDENTDYDISPYLNINALISDFENPNEFLQHKATTVLKEAFELTAEAFSVILPVMTSYQDGNPSNRPTTAELRMVTDLFVTAFKKKRLYFTIGSTIGWVEQEVLGTFNGDIPVKYYNVLEMKLDPVRGNITNRSEWQRTLTAWNRVPTVNPDIVPPENIKRFVLGETIHDIWVERNSTLEFAYDQLAAEFNNTLSAGELFENLKSLLSVLVVRATTVLTSGDYYMYFTDLFSKEDAGEDIRPYLNQLNILISEYRLLRQVYTVLENENQIIPPGFSNLLPSEYEDVINIGIHMNFANVAYFHFVQQEYYENIVLSGNDFQNYSPSIINFPLNMVQETTQWRSPNSDKKAWKDTLNTRIDSKQSALDEWETVIGETEDITMSVMRDALIQALRNNCESLEDTAERLAKTLFIETKDNCCVKHSRVSHAIETLQGFIFSLESGVYDNYLNGFSLSAPNFNREWQWLGSYATWRSAIFTYIYPENLLYPTLKRRQSPAFIELAETIQNANRFTALNACQAAKKYQQYFEDIQNLKIVCTANAKAYVFRKDPQDCCGDLNNSMQEHMTYYFAQCTLNQKAYYSEKPLYAASLDEHDFWHEIPLREDATIVGCLPLYRDDYAISSALWLFYTYKDGGELKLAYLKKDLATAGSSWTEEEEIDLPEIHEITYETTTVISIPGFTNIPVITNDIPILDAADELLSITICQHSEEWDFVYFVFSYRRLDGTIRNVHIRYMAQDDFFDKAIGSILYFDSNVLPITAIKSQVTTNTINLPELIGITLVFENEVQCGAYGSLDRPNPIEPIRQFAPQIIGAFKKTQSTTHYILAGRANTAETRYTEVHTTYTKDAAGYVILEQAWEDLTVSNFEKDILSIAPRYNFSNWESANAVTIYNDTTPAGVKFAVNFVNLRTEAAFSLTPEKGVTIAIESGECIDNYNLRTAQIKEHLRANMNAPQGNPTGILYRTSSTKEVLYEAYYFVPMLLALDQQQRGDYPTALNWYRSVYDYTNNLSTKRKIFYGLVLEENITNAFDRPADWLLDPLNPHLIAQTRTNAYTKYTLMNITQCMLAYADREFTIDTIETVPTARKLYSEALDLLKVNELNVKPSQCYTKSHPCFVGAVTAPIEVYWGNSFDELQNELQGLNDVALIEEASDELADILNGVGTMQTKFTAAFTYLSEFNSVRDVETSNTVATLIDTSGERMNDAYRYLFAELDTHAFNTTVSAKFTSTLATIASLTPQEVVYSENQQKIDWLASPEVDNAAPLEFRFINPEGVQLLGGEAAFNPMRPTPATYQSNLVFANAAALYQPFLYEEDYTPFIDYAFCLPSNPVYSALELKANLELFKIQNCRNIAGMERSLDIFAAPTDSVTGVPVIGAGGNLVLPGLGSFAPSQYRFRVLMERAKQLVSQAQQLEGQFLSILEKEDAENYSQLRARQDLQTAKSTVKLQDMRVKQALNEEVVAELQLDKMEFIQDTYDGWISGKLSGYEIASLALLGVSSGLNDASATKNFLTGQIAQGLSNIASMMSTVSNMMSQLASYQRRSQEWQYQKDLAGYDISIANQQIKIAEQNTRIVSQEREIASLNMGHATDTLEFLKTKFTNAELYRWMGNVLERTYSYMLSLATATAKTAERQYYFEQQQQAGPFIMDDYWEVPQTGGFALNGGGIDRRGMTGSTRLLQDVTKLDQHAFETTKRKLQMTKVISIGQLYPDAFQTFRETGVLNFDLTDRLFDYDFPGHYLRLVNGIKVSVIGLIPVYDNIKATLTAGTTSYTVINTNNMFQRIPIRRMETEQVALTGASRATGVFEFQQQQGELLNPFEGTGIESRWEFKMPRFSNRMDYSNIADVLIEVDYTAMDSFQYRFQVLQDIDNTLGFSRGFSFRNDYPDQWYELQEAEAGTAFFSVDIDITRNQFPQGIDNIRLDGSKLVLHFVRKDGFTDEISIADFSLVSTAANNQPKGGTTVNGTFGATALTNVLSTQSPPTPFVKLRLSFVNTAINREWFSEENVMDILLLINCKAELPAYPL